ncbi:MAG TPA: polysaccharide deacetylase family protein, partial [Chryseosolibacter sp.]|nr:polysaccharide deacetylase family protein [Chryseosolibacter sp.]
MKRPTFVAVVILLFFSADAQEIAITFDDAPTHDGPLLSGHERSRQIMNHLKKEHVDQVAFFVVSGNINASNKHRLEEYVRAG